MAMVNKETGNKEVIRRLLKNLKRGAASNTITTSLKKVGREKEINKILHPYNEGWNRNYRDNPAYEQIIDYNRRKERNAKRLKYSQRYK